MKYLISGLALLVTFIFTSAIAAPTPQAITSVKHNLEYCDGSTLFFKFNNQFNDGSYVVLLNSHNFDVRSTMSSMEFFPRGESEVFTNTFTSAKNSILTGAAHLIKQGDNSRTLCAVSFACECGVSCGYTVVTNGEWCSIDGVGTQSDPYVFQFKDLSKK